MQMTVRAFNFFAFLRHGKGYFLPNANILFSLIRMNDRLLNSTCGAGSKVGFPGRVSAARRSMSSGGGIGS